MALQQFLSKYKNGLVATGVTATFVPIMYNFNKKALFTSQVVNIGVQLGAQSYVAGIAGPSMFSNLDKDTFAKVQAVLFPRQVFLTNIFREIKGAVDFSPFLPTKNYDFFGALDNN